MKKNLLFAMAAGAMLFATSCQNDLDVMGNVGNEALVSFTVTTPEMVTRAYSDGTTADVLEYAVYNAAGEQLTALRGTQAIDISTNVELQLATGNKYTVLFWAAAPNAPYTVDFAGKTMTVDYNGALSNDEARDAFYAKHTFTVTGAQTETVKLYRPFAQLNIGTADYEASEKAGYVPTKSQVKVATYSTLNLWDGTVAGDVTCTYAFAGIPTNEEFPVDGYDYLAMNYVLVGAKQVVDVEFAYTDEASEAKTRTVGSVPVQRNYRTNIYGNLLTSMVDINVEIVPEYNEPAYEADALYQAAAFGGEVTLTEDVTLTAPLAIQANTTIDLSGKTLTGVVTVAEGVQATISNGKIVNTDKTVSGITSNGDLTLNNVEVESARHALRIESGNAVINGGTYKVVPVSNSTLYALNAGDGANSIANVTIKGGTFIGPKGTMADSGGAVTVKTGSTVNIEGGDFSGGKTKTLSSDGTLVVTGGTFDQNPATWVPAEYYSNLVDGKYLVSKSAHVSNAQDLAAVLTSDKEEISIVLVNDIEVAISSLGQQTGGSGEYKLGAENTQNITIDLADNNLTIATTYWSVLGAKNENAVFTIKNGTMTSSQASGTWNSYDLCFANCNYNFEDVVFEKAIALEAANKTYNLKNVTINETHDYYAMWVSAKGQTVNIDSLTINSDGRGIKIDEQYVSNPAKVTMNISNATFETAKKAAVVVKSVAGAEINWGAGNDITNVAADQVFAVWVDEDSAADADKVVVNGAPCKVEGATSVLVYTAEDLNELNATNAYVVLMADIDFQGAAMTKPIQLWKNSTFDGQGHKISNVKTAVQGGYATSLFRGDANPGNKVVKNLVIENLTTPAGYSYAAAIWSDLQGANIEIDNVTINNSTIAANGTIGGFVGFVSASSTSVVIKNSTISNSNLNGGEANHKRGAVVGRAYGCTATCENVKVVNVMINDVAATTSTLVGDKGYTGTVTVK